MKSRPNNKMSNNKIKKIINFKRLNVEEKNISQP
jgi:hypothetical protein